MSKLVLALIGRIAAAEACLEAAQQLALLLRDADIEVLNVRADPLSLLVPGDEILTRFRREKIERAASERAAQARALFETWAARYAIPRDRLDWQDVLGDFHDLVIARARAADMIVLGHAPGADRLEQRVATRAALLETGRPVLLVPDRPPAALTRSVAIAWHEDEPASKAVLAAMPVLEQAQRVWVLLAERDPRAIESRPEILARHHIRAEPVMVPTHRRALGEALLASAHELGADLLVMGAFARNHMLQSVFGGVTHEMMAHGDLPILMAH